MSLPNEPHWFDVDLPDCYSTHLDSLNDFSTFPTETVDFDYLCAETDLNQFCNNAPSTNDDTSCFSAGAQDEHPSDIIPQQFLENGTNSAHVAEYGNYLDSLELAGETSLETVYGHIKDSRTDSYRPPTPCDYCKTHRLQCLVIRTTTANPNPITACSSCVALFRNCSLAEKAKRSSSRFETIYPVIGNLHGINEVEAHNNCVVRHTVDLTEPPQNLYSRSLSRERYSKRSSSRMRGKTKPLRLWFFRHLDNPFPTKQEKLELQNESGLTSKQIQDWFNNARRKQKVSDESHNPRIYAHGSPMPNSTLSDLTPFQRWRHSPPEDEHVPPELLQKSLDAQAASTQAWYEDPLSDHADISDDGNSLHSFLASTLNSVSSDSASSYEMFGSINSHPSDNGIQGNFVSTVPHTEVSSFNPVASYQCTFCEASFKKKSDWCRHETSIHIQLDYWICQPPAATVWQVGSLQAQCNICGIESPSQEHSDLHDFEACAERPIADRKFRRKDHLWQHLKKFHGCRTWKGQSLHLERSRRTTLVSRCGFCNASFSTWSERAGHLARHFRQGLQINQWVGDWGFDEETTLSLNCATLPSSRYGQTTDLLI